MKTVRVAAAIIRSGHKIFATQRGYGEFKDGWEFPGGKIEAGETPQEALVREIREELDAEIQVGEKIDCVEYDYPAFHLSIGMLLGPDPLRGTDLKRTRGRQMALPGRTGQCGLAAGRSVADPEDPGADAGGRRNALRLCRSFLNTSIAYQRHISSRRKSEHCPRKSEH